MDEKRIWPWLLYLREASFLITLTRNRCPESNSWGTRVPLIVPYRLINFRHFHASLSSWAAETARTAKVYIFKTFLAEVVYYSLWVSLFILVSVRIVDRMVVCAFREATHWPACYLWYHSCVHGVEETQKAKRIISAVQHHCLAVQNKELVFNVAS